MYGIRSYMKINKSFRLSEEAVAKLDEQSNATEYLENLILGKVDTPVPWKNLEFLIDQLTVEVKGIKMAYDPIKQTVNDKPIAQVLTTNATFVPKPPDPELGYPCCSKETPCKHWVWDGNQGVWINSLTKKTREV